MNSQRSFGGGWLPERARNFKSWLKSEEDGRGYRPLRQAIAEYLRTSRGVRCNADQIMIVSGIQQALDLLARFLLNRRDPIWLEDPGYFGASIAFGNVGAKIIPSPGRRRGFVGRCRKEELSAREGSLRDAGTSISDGCFHVAGAEDGSSQLGVKHRRFHH